MKIETKKALDFYQVYGPMIEEFGWTKETGAYALVYSFYASGHECRCSLSYIAGFLKCGNRHAINTMADLEKGGYITRVKRSEGGVNLPTEYRINTESDVCRRCDALRKGVVNHSSIGGSELQCTTSEPQCTGVVNHSSLGSEPQFTRGSELQCTQIENNNREDKREEEKRVCAAGEIETDRPTATETEHTHAYHDFGKDFPHVRITDEQYAGLKRYEGMKDGRNLVYYLRLMESQIVNGGKKYKDHALQISLWCEQDGGKVIDSSIDMSVYDAMMNGGRIPRKYYTPTGGLGDDKIIG